MSRLGNAAHFCAGICQGSLSVRSVCGKRNVAPHQKTLRFVTKFSGVGGNADQDDCDEPCPSGWTQFNTRCFLFQPDKKDWTDAERFCTQLGGNLASIRTREEFDFLRGMIRKHTQKDAETWVGGHDGIKEGVWLWSDGSHFEFSLWDEGEPNDFFGEDCMELNQKGKKFANDGDCDGKMPFVCAMVP